MSRLPELAADELTAEQRQVHDRIAGTRGGVLGGPFVAWIRLPAVASAADQLGNAVRLAGKLDRSLFELAVLVVARHWTAQYEWWVHARAAEQCGLGTGIIDAIKEGRRPPFASVEQRIVYELVDELLTTGQIAPATYAQALEALRLEEVIELVTTVGFYSMAALVMNTFEMGVPAGGRALSPLAGEGD